MKVLILKNRIIKSLKSQIKEIVDYYSAIEPLEITEKYVSWRPEYETQKYFTLDKNIEMQVIKESWLKSKVPSGYDIVIFISKEWKCDMLGGLNFFTSNNPKLIIVRYVTGNTFTFVEGNKSITLEGDKLTWTIKHELSHALCNLKSLPDLTHKYYLLGKPKECFIKDTKINIDDLSKMKKIDNYPQYIIVHHTGGLGDTSKQTFEVIKNYHKSLGWETIGYHYYIDKTGKITQGRPDKYHGAHCTNYNNKSIGICLAGNFDLTYPTKEQVKSLAFLLKKLSNLYAVDNKNIVPHRKFANKSCYGKNLTDDWARNLI